MKLIIVTALAVIALVLPASQAAASHDRVPGCPPRFIKVSTAGLPGSGFERFRYADRNNNTLVCLLYLDRVGIVIAIDDNGRLG